MEGGPGGIAMKSSEQKSAGPSNKGVLPSWKEPARVAIVMQF